MNEKQTYRDRLVTAKSNAELKIKLRVALGVILLAAFVWYGEEEEVPFSRIIGIFLAVFILNRYREAMKGAKRPLLFYDADSTFRQAAQLDNVGKLEEFLNIKGKRAVNTFGPDSRKNALHFAVGSGALNAIKYLLDVNADILSNSKNLKKQGKEVPDILNHQDRLGDTPVHVAIKNIISGKTKSYEVLFALITHAKESYDLGNGFKLSINYRIDTSITNNDGKNIRTLLSEIKDHSTPEFQKVDRLIEMLYQAQKQNKDESISVPSLSPRF